MTPNRFHLTGLGVTLAIGMASAAFILGYQARQAATTGQQSIEVKGLAEKPLTADHGELALTLSGQGATLPEALAALRKQRPQLEQFIQQHQFQKPDIEVDNESFEPVYKKDDEGRQTEQLDYYLARQSYTLHSKDVQRIARTEHDVLQLQEAGLPVSHEPAAYLVSNLEQVKMSLIGAATDNASSRAQEFARHGNVAVGSMRSASQGAFYILPANGQNDNSDDYGGVYDKSTINKLARVVVTVRYNLN
ncbi:SIMPL domain-containing protein [Leeia aquatica]|uniref:SIMPL domain-containing protein n=1 Tax=Leeia aquatica TaxID=2725557 RepID=A0A847SBI0_9NEIS|nr:SIMPL domain-containing protein [Leeia aquatica]NLR76255.1 SIMPL domain-containing protein [Leeia aquatica]